MYVKLFECKYVIRNLYIFGIYMYIFLHLRIYVFICEGTLVPIYECMNVCVHVRICEGMYLGIYEFVYARIYVHAYICIYEYI